MSDRPAIVDELLDGPHPCCLTSLDRTALRTASSSGAARSDGRITVNAAEGLWLRNLRRDPRISLVVVDIDNILRHVSVQGRVAEIVDDEGYAHIDSPLAGLRGQARTRTRRPRTCRGSGSRSSRERIRTLDLRRPDRLHNNGTAVRLSGIVWPSAGARSLREASAPRGQWGDRDRTVRWPRRLCWWRSPACRGLALAACGSDLGSGDTRRRDVEVATTTPVDGEPLTIATGRPLHRQVAGRPSTARARRSTTSPRRPGSRSSTWRRSTRTSRSSPRCGRSSRTARRAAATSSSPPTGWPAEYHDLGYLQEHRPQSRCRTSRRTCCRSFATRTFDPGPLVHGSLPERDDRADRPHRPGAGHHLDQRPLRPRSTRARSTLLSELRDTVPLVMKADGIDPETATKEQWLDDDRQDPGRGRLRPDPRHHRERLRRRPRRAATSSPRSAGRATRSSCRLDNPAIQFRVPDRGLHHLVRRHGDPDRRALTPVPPTSS